jgi:acetyltransferase-like isoleucine patch superfamily enzyme
MNLLQFIFGEKIFIITTFLVKAIFNFKKIKYGKNFVCKGFPVFKITNPESITIKDNVTFVGKVDLRTRENGKIILENNSLIESSRLVSAREGKIILGQDSQILTDCLIAGGANVIIGKRCIIGVRTVISSSKHIVNENTSFQDKKFIHSDVVIEDDCWTGVNSSINCGINLKAKTIIGANAVVTKNTDFNSTNVGVPAKKIK